MTTELWTATEKIGEGDNELIRFNVLETETGRVRQEERYTTALPLMFELGGYPAMLGAAMVIQSLPWSFDIASNGQIYIREKR